MSFIRVGPSFRQAFQRSAALRIRRNPISPSIYSQHIPRNGQFTQPFRWNSSLGGSTGNDKIASPNPAAKAAEPRLSLTMTCTVPDCGTRSSHEFTKRSYERGIVMIQCPGCKNRHLIADHLGWFKDTEGAGRTIEDIMQSKGEKVRRGALVGQQGDIEYYDDS